LKNCSLWLQVVNNVVSAKPSNPGSAFATTVHKPALGPSFTYLTDVTIWLSNAQEAFGTEVDESFRIMEIFKARHVVRST